MTTQQVREGTKTVTRRIGWNNIKPGERIMAIVKGQGLKAGEKVEKIREIEIVSARQEPLDLITQEDVVREGFPEWDRLHFINFFCRANKCDMFKTVNRIEFKYV